MQYMIGFQIWNNLEIVEHDRDSFTILFALQITSLVCSSKIATSKKEKNFLKSQNSLLVLKYGLNYIKECVKFVKRIKCQKNVKSIPMLKSIKVSKTVNKSLKSVKMHKKMPKIIFLQSSYSHLCTVI